MPSQIRPEYEIDEDGYLTDTTVAQDTVDVTADVNDYKRLIGTIHRDDADLALYKTFDVLDVTFADEDGLVIMSYRRRLMPNVKFEPMCEDGEYLIHIQDTVQMTRQGLILRRRQRR